MDDLEFDTMQDAFDYLAGIVDDPCVDNERIAWLDDPQSMADYATVRNEGCCGFEDMIVTIDGRLAIIGCNFGH